MNEIRNPREKFKSLAKNRVQKALQTLRLIGNLSNKRHYDYNENDVKKIIGALEGELRRVKQKFSKPPNSDGEFTLD